MIVNKFKTVIFSGIEWSVEWKVNISGNQERSVECVWENIKSGENDRTSSLYARHYM